MPEPGLGLLTKLQAGMVVLAHLDQGGEGSWSSAAWTQVQGSSAGRHSHR